MADRWPGRGGWQREDSHFPSAMSPHLWSLFVPAYRSGTEEGLRRAGASIHHFEMERIEGRAYVRAVFVSADPGSGNIEERDRTAHRVLESRLWRRDAAQWPGQRDRLRARLLVLGRVDLFALGNERLIGHVDTLRGIFARGTIDHFLRQPVSVIPVGEFLRNVQEWTGTLPERTVALFETASEELAAYVSTIDRVADAIGSGPGRSIVGDGTASPGTRLERLRAISPAVRAALDALMDEFVDRSATGFDLYSPTLRESPEAILRILATRISRGTGCLPARVDLTQSAASQTEMLRERVPAIHRPDFDRQLAEARIAYGLHNEDLGISYLWPLGLLRRAMLEAARRLVESGHLSAEDDIFQTTPDEFDALVNALDNALVKGDVPAPACEFGRRRREFEQTIGKRADAGTDSGEDVPAWTEPGPSHTVSRAIEYYLAKMAAEHAFPAAWSEAHAQIHGVGASTGTYEGPACIVDDASAGRQLSGISKGDVLVARTLSPAFNLFLPLVGAVVTDSGGVLCHAAIVARELGIPAVVGSGDATRRILPGMRVRVDGSRGVVDLGVN
jgi:pyruvate,water dikinase